MRFEFKETCPKRGYWCSFRLVDEHGKATPYAGLDYILHDRMGMPYAAKQSPIGPCSTEQTCQAPQYAEQEQAAFFQVEVRDFAKPGETQILCMLEHQLISDRTNLPAWSPRTNESSDAHFVRVQRDILHARSSHR